MEFMNNEMRVDYIHAIRLLDKCVEEKIFSTEKDKELAKFLCQLLAKFGENYLPDSAFHSYAGMAEGEVTANELLLLADIENDIRYEV